MIDPTHIQYLIEIESHVHYGELPPPGMSPFVSVSHDSPVILSAPHGARTFRNNNLEIWHEEDEYTAGIAILLAQLCQTSVIATIWRTEESDPNEYGEDRSTYKRELRRLVDATHAGWIIDLHGASADSANLADEQGIDLGVGKDNDYLPTDAYKTFRAFLEKNIGKGIAERNGKPGFKAQDPNRIAAFGCKTLGLNSVQVEMKPNVRVPMRRIDSSMYQKSSSRYGGFYSAPQDKIIGMLESLVEFIEYIKGIKK
jgi:hypothetical protein